MSDIYYYVCRKNKHDTIGYCNRSDKEYVDIHMKHPEDFTPPIYMSLEKAVAAKKVGFFQISNEMHILQQCLQTRVLFIQRK